MRDNILVGMDMKTEYNKYRGIICTLGLLIGLTILATINIMFVVIYAGILATEFVMRLDSGTEMEDRIREIVIKDLAKQYALTSIEVRFNEKKDSCFIYKSGHMDLSIQEIDGILGIDIINYKHMIMKLYALPELALRTDINTIEENHKAIYKEARRKAKRVLLKAYRI